MMSKHYDVIIVGAGPGGCATAYALRNTSLRIAILDKTAFPRDKICGDALSADVVNQLYRLNEELGNSFEVFSQKTDSHGVRFFSPNGQKLDIDFENPQHGEAGGYIAKRIDFDHFMFSQVSQLSNVDTFIGIEVKQVNQLSHKAVVITDVETFSANIVIGADGAHSIVNRCLGEIKVEKDHYCAGLRQYYEGVNGFHERNHIELHFIQDILPGYFWIFPLPNGEANVGLGMLSSEVSNKKIDLKKKLANIIQNHPKVKDRFKNAKPLENVKGYGLPIGSKKRPISGDNFLLIGDAASLIDPFTGEGIGNAIRSGRFAAEHVILAHQEQLFTAEFNLNYDKHVYDKMWTELKLSRSLQKLLRYPKLFNFVFNKANKNASLKLLLTSMLDNVDIKKQLIKPSFYWKLLFS